MNDNCPICDLPLGDDPDNVRQLGNSLYKAHAICLDIIESGIPTVNDQLHKTFSV